jgi:hypothetical protein
MSVEQSLIPDAQTQQLWSVTTLIKLGLGTSDPLVNWAVNTTAAAAIDDERVWKSRLANEGRDSAIEYLRRRRFESSAVAKDRGSDIHRAAEALALGEPVEIEQPLRPYVDHYHAWLQTHRPRFVMAEAPVYNPRWLYAGTCDGVLVLPSMPDTQFIFDIKTTDKPPDARSRPPYSEVALQMCAYARCTEVGVMAEKRTSGSGKRYYVYDPTRRHEPMPRVDAALCIVVSPYDCFAVPVRIDDGVWQTWLAVLKTARWQQQGSHDLFGAPIEGPGPSLLERQLTATLEAIS